MGSTWAIGIDVGGTKILAVAVPADDPSHSPAGDLLGTGAEGACHAERVETPGDAESFAIAVVGLVSDLVERVGTRPSAIGIGLPGFVDHAGVLVRAPNAPGIVGLDVAAVLGPHTGVPVWVDNDANCAAWAMSVYDVPGATTVVGIMLGTGIGGGLVVDGSLHRGRHGFAGEVGHMIVDADGPACPCGQRGCWEVWASGQGLGRLARVAAIAGEIPELVLAHGADLTGPDVTAAARRGHPEGLALLERHAGWVAVGLVGLINLLDPDAVVLGGGITADADLLAGLVAEALEGYPTMAGRSDVVRFGSLGPIAAAVGAGRLALGM